MLTYFANCNGLSGQLVANSNTAIIVSQSTGVDDNESNIYKLTETEENNKDNESNIANDNGKEDSI